VTPPPRVASTDIPEPLRETLTWWNRLTGPGWRIGLYRHRGVVVSTVRVINPAALVGVEPGPEFFYETIVFAPDGHPLDGEGMRYRTRREARLGHARMRSVVRRCNQNPAPPLPPLLRNPLRRRRRVSPSRRTTKEVRR
jgi:hypothetical protein